MKALVSGKVTRLCSLGIAVCFALAGYILQALLPADGAFPRVMTRLFPPPPAAPAPVVLVTIQDLGKQSWPWSGLDYAVFFNAIAPYRPAVVAVDIPLQPSDPGYQIYDTQLANQMRRLPGVILATADNTPLRGDKVPLVVDAEPTFILQTYARYLAADWRQSVVAADRVILRDAAGAELASVPLDPDGCLPASRRPLDAPAVEFYQLVVSAEQIRVGLDPDIDLAGITGKILLVGTEVPGTRQLAAGVNPTRLQYRALLDLFAGDFRQPAAAVYALAAFLIVAVLSGQAALFDRVAVCWAAGILTLSAAVGAGAWFFVCRQQIYPVLAITLAGGATWLFTFVMNRLSLCFNRDLPV